MVISCGGACTDAIHPPRCSAALAASRASHTAIRGWSPCSRIRPDSAGAISGCNALPSGRVNSTWFSVRRSFESVKGQGRRSSAARESTCAVKDVALRVLADAPPAATAAIAGPSVPRRVAAVPCRSCTMKSDGLCALNRRVPSKAWLCRRISRVRSRSPPQPACGPERNPGSC